MPTLQEASRVSVAVAIKECDRCVESSNHEEIRAFLDAYDGSETSLAVLAHILSTLGERPPPMEPSLALATIETLGRSALNELAKIKDVRKTATIIQRCRLVDPDNKTHCMLRDTLVAELHVAGGDMQAERALDQVPSLADVPASEYRVRARYLSVVASILERKRRYLDAATKHFAAAKSSQAIAATALPKAFVCAILAPHSERQKAMLKQLATDECRKIFGPLAVAVQRAHKLQLLRKPDADLIRIPATNVSQLETRSNGRTPLDTALITHNIHAIAEVYCNITIAELATVLGLSEEDAEEVAHSMILSGTLAASIDQGNGLIAFQADATAPLREWDETINAVCVDVTAIADAIDRQHPQLTAGAN